MSRLETLPAVNAIDFTLSSSSGNPYTLFHDKKLTWTNNTLVDEVISSSPSVRAPASSFSNDAHGFGSDAIFPNLPPLHQGHPEVHLRNGIMNASRLSAAHEPDAEKAFFVADLSLVYYQHQRWKACLPEIQPFYGLSYLTYCPSTPSSCLVLSLFSSRQV